MMLDLHDAVAELFREASGIDERRFDAENWLWRVQYRSGRWSGRSLAPLTFPMSCRFCRRGCHHVTHFGSCPRAPSWARRGWSFRVEAGGVAAPLA